MKYEKKSLDYQLNMLALQEMEQLIPMTLRERNSLRHWVKKGHDVESNPWNSLDEYGYQLNYLQAFRLEHGYSYGPWDHWRGPELEIYWNSIDKHFNPKD